jgi:hypothetical protein
LETGGTIMKDGLVPGLKYGELPPHGVVWLTKSPVPDWSVGTLDCRIKLSIPSHDPKLVRWEPWCNKHAPHIIDILINKCTCGVDHTPSIRNTWVYFGIVPVSAFRVVEYADPEKRAEFEQNPNKEDDQ